jgi:phosphoglycolate phosphatase
MNRPKMILIDVDGTLVDSVPDLAYCIDAMMERLGRPPCGEAAVRNWVGNGVERLIQRALTGQLDGEPDAADFERALPIFLELPAGGEQRLLDAIERCARHHQVDVGGQS